MLEQRIRGLERRLHLMTGLVVVLIVAIATLAARPATPTDEIRATAFVLVDADGAVRGDWTAASEGAALRLLDGDGQARVRLWHDTSATALFLQDANEQARVGAAYFAHGGHGVALHGPGGNPTAVLYMRNDLGSLTFHDGTGVVHRVAPAR